MIWDLDHAFDETCNEDLESGGCGVDDLMIRISSASTTSMIRTDL